MSNNNDFTYSVTSIDPSEYTITLDSTGGFNGITASVIDPTPYVMSTSNGIDIKGDNADIKINGVSMKGWMEKVEERLAILRPNEKLEDKWAELKELGEQYRALEKEILEKQQVWDILKD